MEPPPAKRLKLSERFCPHCDQVLSFKTFQAHKRTYYNTVTGDWIKKATIHLNINHDSGDDTENTADSDSCPPSETEMDQLYPSPDENPPLVDPAITNDNTDGMYTACI